jgi:predicted nucleic acid-binding protein
MNGLAFFDTNILVYADDASSPEKQDRAITLFAEHLRRGTAVVSLQVLQEYFAAATRKLRLAPEMAQRKVEILGRCRLVRFELSDIIAAIELHRAGADLVLGRVDRSRGAFGGRRVLYSEDLQPGAVLAGVRVVNPFVT